MKLLGAALLAVIVFHETVAPQEVGQPAKGAIHGVAVRAGTTSPVPAARVVLRPAVGSKPQGQQAVVTDNEGRFAFAALDPGEYTIQSGAAGYLTASGKPIRIVAAETVANVVMELTPTATLTGAVRDDAGKPVSRVPVHLIRSQYSPSGQKNLDIVMQTYTNDRGEYRLFSISPGRYYIGAGGFHSERPRNNEININDIQLVYRRVFFPNTDDVKSAAALEIGPGESMTKIDFTLLQMKRHRIRGQVIDAAGRLSQGVGPPAPTPSAGPRGRGSSRPTIAITVTPTVIIGKEEGVTWETSTPEESRGERVHVTERTESNVQVRIIPDSAIQSRR